MKPRIPKRKIIYTDMSHGNVEWRPKPIGEEYSFGDKIDVIITPDKGYMIGLISLTEEWSSMNIPYKFVDRVFWILDGYDPSRSVGITFKIPNDNVKLRVKFVRNITV